MSQRSSPEDLFGGAMPPPEKKPKKRDDYQEQMALHWYGLGDNLKVPWTLFNKWRDEYGPEMPLEIVRHMDLAGFQVEGSPQAYVAGALRREQERRWEESERLMRQGAEYTMETAMKRIRAGVKAREERAKTYKPKVERR